MAARRRTRGFASCARAWRVAPWPTRAAPTSPTPSASACSRCMVCHGPEGRATTQGFFPRIAGKPAAYLYNQLLAFREGRRSNSTMAYFVDHMTDAYLQEIANYFAELDLPYAPPRAANATPTQLARGETPGAPGRPCARRAGVRGLPRRGAHRRAAGDSRRARPAAGVPAIAVRLVAGRRAPRARARLHGPDRVAPDAAGLERRGGLAGVATGAGAMPRRPRRSRARCRCRAAAIPLDAAMRGVARSSWCCSRCCCIAGALVRVAQRARRGADRCVAGRARRHARADPAWRLSRARRQLQRLPHRRAAARRMPAARASPRRSAPCMRATSRRT